MKKCISAIISLVVFLFCFSACTSSSSNGADSANTRNAVIGEWVSTDYDHDGPNPGIVLTFKENGTSSRHFYEDLNANHIAGSSGCAWFCEGNTVIFNYGGENEYLLEYDAETNTLVHTEGYLVQTFRKK